MSFGSTTSRPRLRARLCFSSETSRHPSGLAKPLHAELKKLVEMVPSRSKTGLRVNLRRIDQCHAKGDLARELDVALEPRTNDYPRLDGT